MTSSKPPVSYLNQELSDHDLILATRLREAGTLTPQLNDYIAQYPTPKQNAVMLLNHVEELFFGGAAGPGKSSYLLMAALQYVHVPNYAALLLRRTYADLNQPGALMDRARSWLQGTDAHWSEIDHRWTFPSGATLSFGYLKGPRDHFQYQGAEYQFVGFDELTQFPEHQYAYLNSRIRKPEAPDDPEAEDPDHELHDQWLLSQVPLRMRSASNPGDIGHEWVKRRFIDDETREPGVVFVPGLLEDNPHLNQEEYDRFLAKLDPVTRSRLRRGDWDIQEEGELFKRRWFRRVDRDAVPAKARYIRYWDLAATKSYVGGDPDWTVGVLMAEHKGQFWIVDVERLQGSPGEVENAILTTAEWDGEDVPIHIEQEPGASGKIVAHHYRTKVLPGFATKFIPSRQDKTGRARPLSSAAEAGNVALVRARWNEQYLDELIVFPSAHFHDDQVDASSGAHVYLSKQRRKILVGSSARSNQQKGNAA